MTTATTTHRPTPADAAPPAARRLTGFQPTGHMHIGNLIGAIRPMVAAQRDGAAIVFIADLHALTVEHDPDSLRAFSTEQVAILLAAGLDPSHALLYRQSQVPEHTTLHYLLECTTGFGEARRMIQFKEKEAQQQHVRLSLLTYPVLMAADILLHDTAEVPVGADQAQHVELARDIANRFNARYGPTFVVPRAATPAVAARIMDLADPTRKMGKTTGTDAGTVYLLDPPATVRRKVLRAVTDGDAQVRHDPAAQPGVSNLLEVLAACTGGTPASLASDFASYGALKHAVADALIALTEPIRARYAEYAGDPAQVAAVLDDGARRASERARATVRRAQAAIGLR
jgi:tryptophanyl-tRNA synthetase